MNHRVQRCKELLRRFQTGDDESQWMPRRSARRVQFGGHLHKRVSGIDGCNVALEFYPPVAAAVCQPRRIREIWRNDCTILCGTVSGRHTGGLHTTWRPALSLEDLKVDVFLKCAVHLQRSVNLSTAWPRVRCKANLLPSWVGQQRLPSRTDSRRARCGSALFRSVRRGPRPPPAMVPIGRPRLGFCGGAHVSRRRFRKRLGLNVRVENHHLRSHD